MVGFQEADFALQFEGLVLMTNCAAGVVLECFLNRRSF